VSKELITAKSRAQGSTCMLYAKNAAQREATVPMPESAMNPGLGVV
jgi:hypothetical protein